MHTMTCAHVWQRQWVGGWVGWWVGGWVGGSGRRAQGAGTIEQVGLLQHKGRRGRDFAKVKDVHCHVRLRCLHCTEPQQSVTSSAAATRLDSGACHLPSSACTCAAERSASERSCAVPSSHRSGHTLTSGPSASFMSSFWSMQYLILNFRSSFFATFAANGGQGKRDRR